MARWWIVGIGLFLVILSSSLVVSLAFPQTTQGSSEPHEQNLISISQQTVKANGYFSQKIWIDIQGKNDCVVAGRMTEITGNGITFILFDDSNFQSWKEGATSFPLLTYPNITSQSFSFSPQTSGDYVFVFDNRYSPIEKKISASATSSWREVRTETTVPWAGIGPELPISWAYIGLTLLPFSGIIVILGAMWPAKYRRRI